MDFQEVVGRRRMVRAFTAEPVAKASLDRILGNAVRGPSAGFSQGQAFLVLTEPEDRQRFWSVAGEAVAESARTAPVVIAAMSCKRVYLDRYAQPDKGWTDRDEARWPVPYWDIDTGMAALLMLLTAVDEGIAGCFFGVPPEHMAAVHDAFAIPPALTPIGVVSLGYQAPDRPGSAGKRARRGLDEVAFEGRWGIPLRHREV
jgi:nitroreductase